jgi:uncharacterized protein YegL
MKKGLTEIVLIVDKSGSMHKIKMDTIGGFNEFLKSQKSEEGEATITLVLFDTDYNVVYQSIDIQTAAELTENTYRPQGGTALYDAMGQAIKMTKKRIEELPEEERPEKIIFAVLTDGEENSSCIMDVETNERKYTKEKIFKKVSKLQEKSGWVFIYLGANQDAMEVGHTMGFAANNTVTYEANSRGIGATMDSVNKYTKSFRKTSLTSQEFSDTSNLGFMFSESLAEIDEKEKLKADDFIKDNTVI